MLLETLHPLLAAALGLTRGIGSATFPSMANWPEFIEQAERHRLIPLLHHYLLQTGLYASLPETAQGDLRDRIAGITARQLSFTHALTVILKRCAAAAIPCAPLRGPALATWLVPPLAVRAMDDIDLLVPKRLLGTMVALLAGLGYRQIEQRPGFAQQFSYATSFVASPPAPLCVDVHWTLAYPPDHDRIEMDGVWQRAEQREFDGSASWAISQPDLLIHLCAHWRHKGGQGPLLWLVELDRFIRHNQNLDWSLMRELACDRGQWPTVCETLAEIRNLFETPLPEWLLDPVSLPSPSAVPLGEVGPREEWAQLTSLPELTAKLRYAGSLLWPSPSYMRWRYGASNPIALLWAYLRRSVELIWSTASWLLARFCSSLTRLSPRLTLFK
jgi:hypothetical protein